MNDYDPRFSKTIEILVSKSGSLKALAKISGRDPFSFYRSADLSNLDLSQQDLTGLNFEGADLRFCNLADIRYDSGAFNGCIVDDANSHIKDQYEFYASDVEKFKTEEILLHCRVRPNIIDQFIEPFDMTLREFSKFSEVGLNSLRKARVGSVVAMETAKRIFLSLRRMVYDPNQGLNEDWCGKFEQPHVDFLVGGNNAPWASITRERFNRLILLRQIRRELVRERRPDQPELPYRDTPETLAFVEESLLSLRELGVDATY
ncbi:pentapeptide repeat-containing protein [Sphingomonas sp. MMS24-J13]|uniref:pentapeptide repeat-containing protein n=1 Tax=Sphingomonas sp. MMS24-J13 TaxID=3238686 RepID=UPI00384E7D50